MATIAQAFYRESNFGDLCELPHAGSALEHPLVYDSTARELQALLRGYGLIVPELRSPPD